MRKAKLRIPAILLALVLTASLLPGAALADIGSDTRTVVTSVSATTDYVFAPSVGDAWTQESVVFTAPEGAPYSYSDTMGYWTHNGQRIYKFDVFTPGVWKYQQKVSIYTTQSDKYRLPCGDEPLLSATVNGTAWTVNSNATWYSGATYNWIESPEFVLEAAPGTPLTFYDRAGFDIPVNYQGRDITSFSVADYVWGGTAPYTFYKGSGPAWLVVSTDGTVSGWPNRVGDNDDLVIRVVDAAHMETSITVAVGHTYIDPDDRTPLETVALTATSQVPSDPLHLPPLPGEKANKLSFSSPDFPPDDQGKSDLAWVSNDGWYASDSRGGNYGRIFSNETFIDCGYYFYEAQFNLRGDAGHEHVITKDTVITVNGMPWEITDVTIYNDYTRVKIKSPNLYCSSVVVTPLGPAERGSSSQIIQPDDGVYYNDSEYWYKFDVSVLGEESQTVTVASVSGDPFLKQEFRQDGSSLFLGFHEGQTTPVTVRITSDANPAKTREFTISPTEAPYATEVLAFFDWNDIRLSAEMSANRGYNIVMKALARDGWPHASVVSGGDQAEVRIGPSGLAQVVDGKYTRLSGDSSDLLTAGEQYYVTVFVVPRYPYKLDFNNPPVFRRAKALEGGNYSVYETGVGQVYQGNRACHGFFALPDLLPEKLFVETANVSYEDARFYEAMTGVEATEALRGAVATRDASPQAAPVAGACYVARKDGDSFIDLSESTAALGSGEFYAVFVMEPQGYNHWDLARMTRETNPVWPGVGCYDGRSNMAPEYHWIIDADDDTGCVAFAKQISVVPECPAPKSLSVYQTSYGLGLYFYGVSPGYIEEGNPVPNCYRVERRAGDGEWELLAYFDYERDASGQTHPIPDNPGNNNDYYYDYDVEADVTYTYRIRSENDVACSPWVTSASKTAVWKKPANFTATAATVSQDGLTLQLSWNEPDGAVSYTLYRRSFDSEPALSEMSASKFTSLTPIATGLTAPAYTDTDVEIDKWYAYCIKAVNPGGESTLGSTGIRNTKIQVARPGITNLTATLENGVVTLSWDAITGALYYWVERAPELMAATGFETLNQVLQTNSFVDRDVQADSGYTYRIRADFGYRGYSAAAGEIVSVPALPTATANSYVANTEIYADYEGEPGILITLWPTDYRNFDGYNVYRSDDGGAFHFLASVPRADYVEWLDADVLPGHVYQYEFAVYNGMGEGVPTASEEITRTPAAPAWVTAKALPGMARITWAPVELADGYWVSIQYPGGGGTCVFEDLVTGTTCETDYGIYNSSGEHYYYEVWAERNGVPGLVCKSNIITTISHDAVLLEITQQPRNFVGPVGSTATFTVAAEGNGELSYQWYVRKTADGGWSAISAASAKTASYSLTVAERHNGYAYYCAISDGVSTEESDIVTLTVGTPVTITEQPANYVGPVGSTATFTVAAEGGELSYQWYVKKTADGGWSAISGAVSASYSLSVKDRHNGYQYKCVVSDGETEAESEIATLTVGTPLEILREPDAVIVAEGETATFTVEAAGAGELTYQWYVKKSVDGEWSKISAASAKTASYSLTTAMRHNGYQYKCFITDGENEIWSSAAALTVTAGLTITSQPTDQSVAAGAAATFAVEASGAGELTYQWYVKKTADGAFAAVKTGGKSAVYSLTTQLKHNGYQYKCVVSDGVDTVESDIVTLTVNAAGLTITSQPADQSVAEGAAAAFTVEATGAGELTYQWYVKKTADGTWSKISAASAKTASYSLTAQLRHNGYEYKCFITDGENETWTDVVTLTVSAAGLSITSQPTDQSVAAGGTATFSVEATGDGELTYQWYVKKTADGEFAAVKTGGKSAVYSLTAQAKHNGYQYKCVVSDGVGTAESDIVTLTVTAQTITISAQPADATAAAGTTAAFTVTASGSGTLSYQWYVKKTADGDWSAISAASAKTASYSLTTAARHNGYQYKCLVRDSANELWSDVATLTVA